MEDELSWRRPIPLDELEAAVRRMKAAGGASTPQDSALIMKAIRIGQIRVEGTPDGVRLHLYRGRQEVRPPDE